jgi:hypothetical protein
MWLVFVAVHIWMQLITPLAIIGDDDGLRVERSLGQTRIIPWCAIRRVRACQGALGARLTLECADSDINIDAGWMSAKEWRELSTHVSKKFRIQDNLAGTN